MILPQTGSLAIPTPRLQKKLCCQGRPRPASAWGKRGLALEVLSPAGQQRRHLRQPIPFSSVCSPLVDSCSRVHLLPNKGLLLVGDHRWGSRWSYDLGEGLGGPNSWQGRLKPQVLGTFLNKTGFSLPSTLGPVQTPSPEAEQAGPTLKLPRAPGAQQSFHPPWRVARMTKDDNCGRSLPLLSTYCIHTPKGPAVAEPV